MPPAGAKNKTFFQHFFQKALDEIKNMVYNKRDLKRRNPMKKTKKPAFFCLQEDRLFGYGKFPGRFREDAGFISENMIKQMFCKHITLAFKPTQEDKDFYYPLLGKKVEVKFGELITSRIVCCYVVTINMDIYKGESKPHLTVATAEPHPPSISNPAIMTAGIPGMFKCESVEGNMTGRTFTLTIKAATYGKDGIEYVTDRELLR